MPPNNPSLKFTTPEYRSWTAMRNRCNNKNNDRYDDYGGRGISVCKRWGDFNLFLLDMGRRPDGTTLDRWPDKNGNYEPSNCRWATQMEQNNNQRKNIFIEAFGKTKTLAQWSREYGVRYDVVYWRYINDWSNERIVTP